MRRCEEHALTLQRAGRQGESGGEQYGETMRQREKTEKRSWGNVGETPSSLQRRLLPLMFPDSRTVINVFVNAIGCATLMSRWLKRDMKVPASAREVGKCKARRRGHGDEGESVEGGEKDDDGRRKEDIGLGRRRKVEAWSYAPRKVGHGP
ncbi:hypothetical protein CPC08DRAFT_721718 [Agrocybe pediades]|nr:hypothetical protein CPC08DRAFT_721718 [Agrocybe pediades]